MWIKIVEIRFNFIVITPIKTRSKVLIKRPGLHNWMRNHVVWKRQTKTKNTQTEKRRMENRHQANLNQRKLGIFLHHSHGAGRQRSPLQRS